MTEKTGGNKMTDALTIAVFAAEQLLSDTDEMMFSFVMTQFGPIVQIEAVK